MSSPLRRAAIATTAVAGLTLALPGLAGALNVIPGDTNPGLTIITAKEGVDVTVDSVDRDTGAVSGTFKNDSGANLNCVSPNPNPNLQRGGTVTTAEVARDSMAYYSEFQSGQPGGIDAGSRIVFIDAGVDVRFWPLLQLLPTGSAAQYLSDGTSIATSIGNANQDAKMKGMVGDVDKFTVNNGQTKDWTSALSPAAQGERGKDPLAALFVCKAGNQNYAWAGYEEFTPPAPDAGSLSAISSGSMGSNEAENPSTDPDATDSDDTP